MPHSHDASDSIDDALEASSDGIRAVKISLVALALTSAAQLAIVILSGSVALLADTIHNFSDALTALPLWLAFSLARRGTTRRYTYGFGRAEDLAGLFIVTMIGLSALVAGYESLRRLLDPQPLEHLGWVAAAGIIGFAGNEIVAEFRIRSGRRIGSAALVADGQHARADGFTSLAVVLGAAGVFAGFPLTDPIVGLLISLAICMLLWGTAREVGRRLLDGVDPQLVDRAESSLEQLSSIRRVQSVCMRWAGHRLHVTAVLGIDPATTVADFNTLAEQAESVLRQRLPNVGTVSLRPGR